MKKRLVCLALALMMALTLMPFGAAAYDDGEWSEAYRAFVMEDGWKNDPDLLQNRALYVLLYDMDRDGVPELMLYTGNKSYDWNDQYMRSCFYTYADGAVKKLGPGEVGYPMEEFGYAPYSEYPGLVIDRYGPYHYSYYYSIENGALHRELVLAPSGAGQTTNPALERIAQAFIGHNMPDEVGSLLPTLATEIPKVGWDEFVTRSNTAQFYIDVPVNHYYTPAVAWAMETEVTNGTALHLFSPEDPCTRGQIVTFLWRAAGRPEPQGTGEPFGDVAPDAYYAKAVQWAVEQEITNGTGGGLFSPESPCTRAQVVTFLWRSAGRPDVEPRQLPFTDLQADAYYMQAVIWAINEGVTNGTSLTTFSPENTCSRGQIVTFLYRRQAEQ